MGFSVLVVDDDSNILLSAVTTLTKLGYEPTGASSATDALERLQRDPGIDLLVTDLDMPGMHGLELVEHALALRPKLKILYTSSYVAGARGNPALRYGPFIGKPWVCDELRELLIGLLGDQATRGRAEPPLGDNSVATGSTTHDPAFSAYLQSFRADLERNIAERRRLASERERIVAERKEINRKWSLSERPSFLDAFG